VTSLISTVGIKYDDFGTPAKLKKTAAAAQKTEKAFDQLGGKAAGGGKKLGLFGNAALGVGAKSKIAAIGVKTLDLAIKSTVAPLLAFTAGVAGIGAAFNTMKEIDFASAKFRTLGGDSKDLVNRLKILSIELNGSASVAELTGAAYDVASAGFTNAKDAAMILKAASLGATGGFTDINTAGGAAVKVLNAYGLSAQDASALMDKFAQTQADGIITIGQYSSNIGKVATTAAGLGIRLKEVNAVLAQSTAAGTNIETAFTGLNSALAKISSGQVGKKLGIDLNEATLRSEGLVGALQKLEGFSTGQLQDAFGIEAFKGIQVAIQDTEKLNKLIENQEKSQGAAAKAAFIAQDTLMGSIQRIGTVFTNIFAGQSELVEVLKFSFYGVSAAVELLAGGINSMLAPFRQLLVLLQGVGNGISEAFGGGKLKLVQGFSNFWNETLAEMERQAQETLLEIELFGENFVIAIRKTMNSIQNIFRKEKIEGPEFKTKADLQAVKELEKAEVARIKAKDAATKDWQQTLEQVKQTMADGIHGAIMGLLDGTKSLAESLAGVAKQLASMFLKKAIYGAFDLNAEGGYKQGGFQAFASGGMVTKPTMGLVGEAGEDEYIIPASKMAQSMQRYSAGARGESVIPGTGSSYAGGGAGGSTTVSYSGPILNFNSEEFVPKSAVGQIIATATSQGAKAGENRTLSTLRNSRSARSRLGM
jgi:TP901 family phage tail tape measure protein